MGIVGEIHAEHLTCEYLERIRIKCVLMEPKKQLLHLLH